MTCINSYGTLTYKQDHPITARRPDLIIINQKKKKKENLQNCQLCCPGGPQNRSEENVVKYHDLARELKKLRNMRVTIVPIVFGALGTITKGLLKGLENLEVRGRVDVMFWPFDPAKNAIQGDAPERSDTF